MSADANIKLLRVTVRIDSPVRLFLARREEEVCAKHRQIEDVKSDYQPGGAAPRR
jgi:hypothetical protein